MIKYLIFDFDGVIVDSEILAAKAFSQVLTDMNIENKYTTEIIAEKFAGNKMFKVAEEICKIHNIVNKNTYLKKVMKLVSELYNNSLKPVEGFKRFLELSNFDNYICSNSGKQRIIKGLRHIGLENSFDEKKIYTFEMVNNPKPSPDIYLKLIQDNNITNKEALVLEDSVPGVSAAVAANLNVVGVTVGSHWSHRSHQSLIDAGSITIMKSYLDLNKIIQNY